MNQVPPDTGSHSPMISVVVSTRNRDDSVSALLRSVLDNGYPDFEIIIVDQSKSEMTEHSVRPFLANSSVHYIKSNTKGVSVGRNIGIDAARGEYILITDDDCEMNPHCLHELAAAFALDENIGVVFGNVLALPYDRSTGFITAYVRKEPFLARDIHDKHLVEGISACMGIRRSTWEALGGFDELLGVGGRFKSAAETGLTIQALLAGYYVYETPAISVTHGGFRTWEQAHHKIHCYLYGIGAMLVRHLKCGQWSVLWVFYHLALRWTFGRPVVDLGIRSFRWLRLRSFIQGFLVGLVTPVNRTHCHYIDRRKQRREY